MGTSLAPQLIARKKKAALLSIASTGFLAVIKFASGIMMNSIGVISEGVHSLLDLTAAVVTFYSVSESSKPADRTHPFGHGKIESLSGAFQAVIIIIPAMWIIIESVKRILNGSAVGDLGLGVSVMLLSMILNFFVSKRLTSAAKETESVALEADSLHLSVDFLTSFGVIAALFLIRLTGIELFDPVIAVLISLVTGFIAVRLAINSISDLLDQGLPHDVVSKIEEILRSNYPQIVGFHRLRTRRAGSEKQIDMHLEVCKYKSFDSVHQITQRLEDEIEAAIPYSFTVIHPEPCKRNCAGCRFFTLFKEEVRD